jgi:hypothetical protein
LNERKEVEVTGCGSFFDVNTQNPPIGSTAAQQRPMLGVEHTIEMAIEKVTQRPVIFESSKLGHRSNTVFRGSDQRQTLRTPWLTHLC